MLDWVEFSNPVAIWWVFLTSVSVVNIAAWIFTFKYFNETQQKAKMIQATKAVLALSAVYVFVCAFRSVLPRADVQRICIFDTWFSTILVGRSVATIAELSFVAQWAIVLHLVGKVSGVRLVKNLALVIVPLIAMAECFSWTAVVTTNYLGNTCEESTWLITYCLIFICLVSLWPKFQGSMKFVLGLAAIGCLLYVFFMATVDVPMYFNRWQADLQSGRATLGLMDGFHDLNTRWVVSHDIADWKTEIPWMSLYFSVAVWSSIGLCYIPLTQEGLRAHFKQMA